MSDIKENTPLTVKQEKFCEEYVKLGNAKEAYKKAFKPNHKSDDVTYVKASELLRVSKIKVRVQQIKERLQDKYDIPRQKLLEELDAIAFSSIANLHNTWIERKDFEKLTDRDKASIKSISTKVLKKNIGTSDDPEIVDVEYVKIELYDKLLAMKQISTMLGYDAPKEVNLRQTIVDIETGIEDDEIE